jgi:hypothetical protein
MLFEDFPTISERDIPRIHLSEIFDAGIGGGETCSQNHKELSI